MSSMQSIDSSSLQLCNNFLMLKMMVHFTIFVLNFALPFGPRHDRTVLTAVRANRSTVANRRHLADSSHFTAQVYAVKADRSMVQICTIEEPFSLFSQLQDKIKIDLLKQFYENLLHPKWICTIDLDLHLFVKICRSRSRYMQVPSAASVLM